MHPLPFQEYLDLVFKAHNSYEFRKTIALKARYDLFTCTSGTVVAGIKTFG